MSFSSQLIFTFFYFMAPPNTIGPPVCTDLIKQTAIELPQQIIKSHGRQKSSFFSSRNISLEKNLEVEAYFFRWTSWSGWWSLDAILWQQIGEDLQDLWVRTLLYYSIIQFNWIQVDYEYKNSLQNILYLLFACIHHS